MKRLALLFSMMCICTIAALAQRAISGKISDRDTGEGVTQATVSLLKKDSTFVKGVISDTKGHFSVTAPSNGSYLIKITSVGYKTLVKQVSVADGKNVALGKVVLSADAVMLKEAVVSGQAAKVVVKEDTFVYNAAAYHTPEGSVIEELVKRLPGAQVSDDGAITINGKTVKKILVDGKEFMTGDTETALKNLPTSIIEKVKAYDQKSDLARVTGIDDGEEETVLDFGIKRGMNKGIMSNVDLAYGTHQRYAERGMIGYTRSDLRVMGFGNANNTGDQGFPGGGGGPRFGGGAGNGLAASKMLALNFNYEKDKIFSWNTNIRWNHNDNDTWAKKSTENFVNANSFGNSLSQSFQRRDRFNANMRIEWNPDTLTNIMFRPQMSLSKTDNISTSTDATFNEDPYLTVDDPLSDAGMEKLKSQGKVVNTSSSSSLSYSDSKQYSGMLQYNRKLGKAGRNFTLRANVSYNEGASQSTSLKNTLSQAGSAEEAAIKLLTDTTLTNRYTTTPTKSYNINGRATYTEPLTKTLFLQASYQFKYSKSKSDRTTYDFSDAINGRHFMDLGLYTRMPEYRAWDAILREVDTYPNITPNDSLSKYSEYDTYTHEGSLQLRKVGQKWNYTVGIMVQPQNSEMKYKYQGLDTIVKRSVFNFAPSLDLRYKISKVSQMRATYRVQTSQPSMTDLLEVYDDANKLNISTGNAGLKPAFSHNFNFHYNGFAESHTQSWMTFLNFSLTQNQISSMVHYFDKYTAPGEFDDHEHLAGSQLTRPENINGNWNAGGAVMYNASVDSAGVWNINTFTNLYYRNNVSYLFLNTTKETSRNTTRQTTVSERLAFSYRSSWLEVEPNGNVSYSHSVNELQPQSNLDTWSFNYGLNINITAPWGTGFATDAHMNSRRGYSDASANTNEFVWNAQISQSFLKGKPLTVMLQFYDILQNQSNFSRAISSTQRSDSEYNTINSYCMLHVTYRFNSFGGKEARRGGPDGGRPDFNDRRFDRGGDHGPGGGGFGGGPGGGFGGGHRM